MKPALQLRQSQHLAMTPQLQQSIRLLQLSTLEINQEAARLLDENPMLEREDDISMSFARGDHADERDAPGGGQTDGADDDGGAQEWGDIAFFAASPDDEDDDDPHPETAARADSLREHLLWQTSLSPYGERDKRLIGLLIDALDENGYLSLPLEEIGRLIPPELDIAPDDLETALAQLQHLGAPGIGARTLGECLALQLKALPPDTPGRALAQEIVTHHLALLGSRDFAKLKKALRCDDDALRAARTLIVHLNPKPGTEFSERAADYVTPDIIVERHRGVWHARLNPDAMPRLRLNQTYVGILQQCDGKDAQQLAGQLQEARWFIKNLQQRFETILRVSQAIVEHQKNFFEHGDIAMRPLVLREIADELDLHESTVSRATTQKYMLTPNGIYELKHFFGSGIANDAGDAHSATAIRTLIKQMVGEEDARHPLSDNRMSEILTAQGIPVACRTVAKYRKLMHIPPTNLRKTL